MGGSRRFIRIQIEGKVEVVIGGRAGRFVRGGGRTAAGFVGADVQAQIEIKIGSLVGFRRGGSQVLVGSARQVVLIQIQVEGQLVFGARADVGGIGCLVQVEIGKVQLLGFLKLGVARGLQGRRGKREEVG